MTPDHFEATFVLSVDRATAWERLTDQADGWLAGFDDTVTVVDQRPRERFSATKDHEPCGGTEIVVTLADAGSGTRITVVQSGFGAWMPPAYDVMLVGWRHIVADLQTYLSTGAHAARHLRPWGDLGADATPGDGGLRVSSVRPGALADRLGLVDGDLLTVVGGAPVSTHDDLVTVLRVVAGRPGDVAAEWVRGGEVRTATATATAT